MAASSLQDRRVWLGGGAAAAVVIAAASWFLLISPEMSSAADLHSRADDQRAQNDLLTQKVATLKNKSEHLSKYTTALARALAALPVDSGLPALTREVNGFAASAHVQITSIAVGTVTATSTSVPTTAPADTSSTESDSSTNETTTSSAPSTTSGAAGGTFSIPITVISNGTLARQVAFLDALRSAGPRYGLITNVQLSPGTGARVASVDAASAMTTQFTVFASPQGAAEVKELKKLLNGDIGN
jgi:hypothetical protein